MQIAVAGFLKTFLNRLTGYPYFHFDYFTNLKKDFVKLLHSSLAVNYVLGNRN